MRTGHQKLTARAHSAPACSLLERIALESSPARRFPAPAASFAPMHNYQGKCGKCNNDFIELNSLLSLDAPLNLQEATADSPDEINGGSK
jgi:hypothetical protein